MNRTRLGIAAGIAALALLASLGLWGLFGGRGDRGTALASRGDAEAAHALAASLVKQLEGRTSPGAVAALEDARRRITYTEEEQADGERELASSSYVLADRQFARALEGYTRACQDLADHWLRAAADVEAQAAKDAAAALSQPDPGLSERAQALAASSATSDCSGAEAERARLVAAETLRSELSTHAATAQAAPSSPVAPLTAAVPSTGAAASAPGGAPELAKPEPAKPAIGTRPVLPDRTAEKRAVAAAISTWNRALNARDWALLQSVQKLRPGQLESYQHDFESDSVRQSVSIRWIAELAPNRFETEVVLKREVRKFFVWRDAGTEKRQAIAVLEGGKWTLTGL